LSKHVSDQRKRRKRVRAVARARSARRRRRFGGVRFRRGTLGVAGRNGVAQRRARTFSGGARNARRTKSAARSKDRTRRAASARSRGGGRNFAILGVAALPSRARQNSTLRRRRRRPRRSGSAFERFRLIRSVVACRFVAGVSVRENAKSDRFRKEKESLNDVERRR